MIKEKGQVILLLILVMTVALAIGLSIVQKSLVDVSTATKVEQSQRAFSAAEAGIEKTLKNDADCSNPVNQVSQNCKADFNVENNSSATIQGGNLIPAMPPANTQQEPLEYPPLAKEEVAQVWLANLNSTNNPPDEYYKQTTLDVYWGDPAASNDKAAIELTLVYYGSDLTDPVDTSVKYRSRKWYLDNPSATATRNSANNFNTSANCPSSGWIVGTYQCKFTIGGTQDSKGVLPAKLMLLRARLLYNSASQPFAVQAVGTCGNCSIPPQARILTSTGVSGETQRKIKILQVQKVVPSYFDYAIFSVGEIRK